MFNFPRNPLSEALRNSYRKDFSAPMFTYEKKQYVPKEKNPTMEITDESTVLTYKLPGVSKRDITMTLEDQWFFRVRVAEESGAEEYRSKTITTTLQHRVLAEKITATYHEGLLKVTLPHDTTYETDSVVVPFEK